MTLKKLLNHPIVIEMVTRGIEPKIKAGGLVLDGFYKSGTVLLYMNVYEKLEALSRYNEVTPISELKDLVKLNLEWWETSSARNQAWLTPEEPWKSIAIEMGLLEEVVKTYTEYRRK